jgi:decaprenyl-phosphate phosphoribosyltransferase
MFKHYVSIARPDHWFKNIFMLPGIIIAWIYLDPELNGELVLSLAIGILATCLIASANYVINEWLDAQFDKFHPLKKDRPSLAAGLKSGYVYMEYALLAVAGLSLSLLISWQFFITQMFFLCMGIIYNVKPIRTKEKAYIDVITESVNNPIRFILGWLIIMDFPFPPSSVLIAYWMGGAFLMATKRFAEYRFIGDREIAGLYRKSFLYYNERRLLVSAFFYALCSSFFLGIFLIKYRIELLISFPFIALMFSWYLRIGFEENSIVQTPEKLFRKKKFILYVLFLFCLMIFLFLADIKWFNWFLIKIFE